MTRNKKLRAIAKVSILLSFFALIVTCVTVFVLNKNNSSNPNFININKVYSTDNKEITSTTHTSETKYVSISNVNENSMSSYQGDNSTYVIALSTSDDLVTLSTKCYSNSEYLKCNYELINNITYSSNTQFIPLGWQQDKTTVPFTGIFNGNGYDITNLNFIQINASNIAAYSGNEHFAFVAENSGTIKNLGLVEPFIAITEFMDSLSNNGVANFCGKNTGTIDSCFVRQLNKTLTNECGITALGGYRVSGFVIDNSGTISNSYLATNSLYNRTCTDIIEFADIALSNTGTISDVYFYNNSIDQYKSTYTKGGYYSFVYDSDLNNYKGKNGSNYPGDWVKTIDDLRKKFSSWTTTVGSGSNTYTYTTPVKRSITLTNNQFTITSANDFVMLFELMNLNPVFASSVFTYSIEADIDLSYVSPLAIYYKRGIGATITGKNYVGDVSVSLITGEKNNYPTIYNANIIDSSRKVTNLGVDAYGFIPYYTGEMSNLNFYYSTDINLDTLESSNLISFGSVVGYLENGSITNINTYANIKTTTSNKLKENYIGGVVGIIGESSLEGITTNGSIELASPNTYTPSTTYMQGVSIGGIAGFSENTYSSVKNSLNAMNITYTPGVAGDYAISGVVGAGYFTNTNKLENKGTITINTSTGYTNLYVSGVIGRILGIRNQTSELTNQGSVEAYLSSNTSSTSYVAGILNADIVVTASNSLTQSEFVNNANQRLFYASSLANRANVTIISSGNNLNYTSGINVLSKNGFISQISNLYNLPNNELYKANNTSGKYTSKLRAQAIDVSIAQSYAGLLNNITSDTSSTLNLSDSYNLRDITFSDSASISSDLYYAGCVRGSKVNYSKVYNEGKLTFTISQSVSTTRTLNVSGVFEELSDEYSARYIFNGADITFTDNANSTLKLDLNIAGIVLNNKSVDSSTSQRVTSNDFDKEAIGTLDNAINNGNILVTSTNLDKNMASASGNDVSTITFPVLTSRTYLNGNINASGVTITNNGIISNTFNLGDVNLEVFALSAVTYNASGIACYLDGEYAGIKNSANNGDISVVNMANMTTSSGTASLYSEYVSGIAGKNNSSTTNINEIISFTINYGTIKGYAGYINTARSTVSSQHSYVAGILAYGACNIVNVLNYGNIYGSEVVGSMVAGFDLNTSSTTFYLSNTINYGNVKLLAHYNVNGTTRTNATFTDITSLESIYVTVGTYTTDRYSYNYVGAMFGLVNFASGSGAKLNIRYVINFYQSQSITQTDNQLNNPTTAMDTDTFITCKDANETFGSSKVAFAPLSTISDSAGNVGVFSSDFIFRKAIKGDTTAVDYTNHITDKYISDYFSFVVYDKVNTYLIEKIGWRNYAYLTAAEELARNVEAMSTFVSNVNYLKDIDTSLNSTSWTSNIDSTLLNNAITEIINNKELTDKYQDIINYFVLESNYTSSVYKEIKNNIIESILASLDNDNTKYSDLLQTLLYDEVLAKVIKGEDANYQEVQTKINELLGTISEVELRNIITNYLNNVDKNTELDKLFDGTPNYNSYYALVKYNLVNTLVEGYSDETLELLVNNVVGDNKSSNNSLKYYEFLKNYPDNAKDIYSAILTQNSISSSDTILSALLNTSFKKYSTDITSAIDSAESFTLTDTYTSSTGSTYINGDSVSYSKDYTELWNIIKNDSIFTTYLSNNRDLIKEVTDPTSGIKYNAVIAKATEYNSTYQTQSGKTKATSTYQGVMRSSYLTNGWEERYIYMPDDLVNDSTYYYGPFNQSGVLLNVANSWDSGKIDQDIYNAVNVTSNKNYYAPFFMSLDEATRTSYINASNTTSNQKSIGTYYWNDKQSDNNAWNQWVCDYIIQNSPSNCKYFLQKVTGSGEYIRNGYDYSATSGTNDTTVYTYTTNGHESNIKNDKYVTGYGTSQVYTGIWYPVSIWYDSKVIGVYLTAQDDGQYFEKNTYKGIFTTQYTYYTIDDLVKLDGIRTRGKSSSNTDSDEVAIISAIMTKVLGDVNGQKAVLKALASYASTTDFITSQAASIKLLASSVASISVATKIASEQIALESTTNLSSLKYDTTTTVYAKLEDLTKDYGSTKQKLTFYASENKDGFIKLLKYCLTDFSEYDNDSGTNTITSSDFTYHLYNYIEYLRKQDSNISASSIVSIINTVNSTDLDNLKKLDDLTYIKYVENSSITHGDSDYGTSTDIKALASVSNNEIGKLEAYPFKWESTTKVTKGTSDNPEKSSVTYYSSNSGNVNYVATTLQASTKGNNIGYFVGSDLKVYQKEVSYDTFYYPSNSTTSETLPCEINGTTYNAPSEDIKNYLSNSGGYLLRMTAQSTITKSDNNNGPTSANSYYLIENAQVGSWTGTALVPSRAIWLAPIKAGTFKFVLYNADTKNNMSFSIKRLTRSTKGDYSTYFTNYETTQTYDNLLPGKAYYFEYNVSTTDIDAGYEYAIVCDDTTTAPYFAYLDLGDSATLSSEYPDLSTIESNYNKYYSSLSTFAKTILAKDMINVNYSNLTTLIGTEPSSITVSEPTIMLVKTNTAYVPITVSGNTKYNNSSGEEVTVSSVTINSKGVDKYTAFYLGCDRETTYTISATSDCISEILLVKQKSMFTTSTDSNSLLHVKYNGTDILSGISNYTDLSSYQLNVSQKLLDTLKVIYPTIKEDSKYSIFNESVFTQEELRELVSKLAYADDENANTSVLYNLIASANGHYQTILENVESYEAKVNILNKIIEIKNDASDGTYPITQYNIIATFIGNDYLNYSNANSLTSSKLYTLLNSYENGKYQFITGDSTIDYGKFDAFLEHLNVKTSMTGYGIYALSSSLGQKNGIFIPDNFDLTSMDANYKTSDNGLTIDESNTSSYWRDGQTSTTETYDVTNTTSVNYKFRKEMKQLKLSISTEMLTADITSGTYTIYATESTIDSTKGKIYYYVPQSYIDYLKTISDANLSETHATSATCSTKVIDFTKGSYNDLKQWVVEDAILVTAEDTSVSTNYDIVLVPQTITVNSITSDKSSIVATGELVTLTVTTTGAPDNFDLTSYLTVNDVKLSNLDKQFYLDETYYNNGIVSNNTSTIKLYIKSSHTGGEITFKVSVYSSEASTTITKTKASSSTFKAEFEGSSVTFNSSTTSEYKGESSIKVGRIFTYSELSTLSYLTSYTLADNATYSVEVSYNNTVLGNDRYQYAVTITVTSEDKTSTSTYIHYLNEMDYFDSSYANIYQDGNNVTDLYTNEFESQNVKYNDTTNNTTSLIYDKNKTNFASVAFERGYEYEYRIKYVLNNFYLDDATFSNAKSSSGCSISLPSGGMTVVVGSTLDTGVYYFNYQYTRSVKYSDDVTITRTYTFPTLFIIKRESTDALLKRITFLDSTKVIGDTLTVIQADTRNTSETTKTSSIYVSTGSVANTDGNETTYSTLSASTTRYININNNSDDANVNIKYGSLAGGTSTTDSKISDYYTIGTVNEAELSYYSPIFGVDEYAQMYQYTTKRKLQEYGDSNKSGSDYSDANILGDHTESNTVYLYVPFTYSNNDETKTQVFFVELDKDYNWTNVYETTSDPTDSTKKIAEMSTTTKEATDSTKASFTYNGITYTVSDMAGKAKENVSLYMDYIGSPLAEHFWYVSYMVLSEAALAGRTSIAGNVRYYHVSIIDTTNNIYFETTLYSEIDLGDNIYMTIAENIYSTNGTKTGSKQISGHFTQKTEVTKTLTYNTDKSDSTTYKYKYTLRYNLSILPKGYFSFYLDLENGYSVYVTTSDANQIDPSKDPGKTEEGTFLPYTSIITRTIKLNFYVKKDTNKSQIWAVKQGSIFTYKATYLGKED